MTATAYLAGRTLRAPYLPTDPAEWSGERIRALRRRLGWTQEQMASALGYGHARSVSALENEYPGMRPSRAVRVLLDLIDQHDGLPSRKG
jgi:DNA-binding XRE family transcriptional regulator